MKKVFTTLSLVVVLLALLLSTVPVSAKSTEPDGFIQRDSPGPAFQLQRMEVQQIVPRHKKTVVAPVVNEIVPVSVVEVPEAPVVIVEEVPDVPYTCHPFCDKNKFKDGRVHLFE